MQIKVSSEKDLLDMCREHLHISVNMRHWQKRWHEEHGCVNLKQKKIWEERMDEFLERINAQYGSKGQPNVKIKIEE